MFDLDKIISEAYGEEPMSFDKIAEMVENMLILQESMGVLKEEDGYVTAATMNTKNIKPVKIFWRPYVQISEVKWGSLTAKKKDARDKDGDGRISQDEENPARAQLKLYLNALPAGDIKSKIDNLNTFINDINSESPVVNKGIGNSISFMMFYRTLYDIISDFNASAAGFIFESFLAVLLDAERGHQIPASGAKTIADFIVYPNGGRIPISLKLYAAGSLKIGGSYVQLVEDLTGEMGMMQYIIITKTVDEQDNAQSLKFYAFNFTLDNVAKILTLAGEKGRRLIALPTSIIEAYDVGNVRGVRKLLKSGIASGDENIQIGRKRIRQRKSPFDPTGQFKTRGRTEYTIDLDIPAKTKVSLKPAFDAIDKALTNEGATPMSVFLNDTKLDPDMANAIKTAFLEGLNEDFKVPNVGGNGALDELIIGQSQANDVVYAYTSGGSMKITSPTREKIHRKVYDELKKTYNDGDLRSMGLKETYKTQGKNRNLSVLIKSVLDDGQKAQKASKTPAGKDPRSLRIKEIYGEFTAENLQKSLNILNDRDFNIYEKKKLLILTAGFNGASGDTQFELRSKTAFEKLYTREYAGDLPYTPVEDDGSFAELVITEQKVIDVSNTVMGSFNRNMSLALNAMQNLVDHMNEYVIGGLENVEKAEEAANDAQDVKVTMDQQVRDTRAQAQNVDDEQYSE